MSHSHIHSYSFIFYLLNWMLGHLAMRSEPNPVGPTLARRTPSYTSPYLSLCPARDNHLISFHGPFLDFTSLFIFFFIFFHDFNRCQFFQFQLISWSKTVKTSTAFDKSPLESTNCEVRQRHPAGWPFRFPGVVRSPRSPRSPNSSVHQQLSTYATYAYITYITYMIHMISYATFEQRASTLTYFWSLISYKLLIDLCDFV